MSQLLIDRLDRHLAKKRPEYFALLQPGASRDELDAFETQFRTKLPEAFRQLYTWRNGQDPNSSAPLCDNRTFTTLADMADTKELLDGMIGEDFGHPAWWRRGWVPFLHNGGGSHLCLDVTGEEGGQRGQLVAFWKSDADRPVEFPSLEAWLAKLLSAV
jgi:cell wall assembly regulator SMI1